MTFGGLLDSKLMQITTKLNEMQEILSMKADVDTVASKAEVGAITEKMKDIPSRGQLRALEEAVQLKADASEVPSAMQFLGLFDTVTQKADASAVPTNSSMEAVMEMLASKADASNVPTNADMQALKDFTQLRAEAGELMIKEQFEVLSSRLDQLAGQNEQELQGLRTAMHSRADMDSVALARDLRDLRSELASMPSNEQLHAIIEVLQLKANAAEVPSNETFVALSETVHQKADAATVEGNFESLKTDVQKKADAAAVPTCEELLKVSEMLECKAEALKVPTLAQFDSLAKLVPTQSHLQSLTEDLYATLRLKANAAEVPTLAQFGLLSDTITRKADADSVPTHGQLESVIQDLQRESHSRDTTLKQELASVCEAVLLKANVDDVPSKKQFYTMCSVVQQKANSSEVPSKAAVLALKEALNRKANSNETISTEAFEALKVQTELATETDLALRAELRSLQAFEPIFNQQLEDLKHSLLSKADSCNAQIQALKQTIKLKADCADVPSKTDFKFLSAMVSKISGGDEEQTLIKRRRSMKALERPDSTAELLAECGIVLDEVAGSANTEPQTPGGRDAEPRTPGKAATLKSAYESSNSVATPRTPRTSHATSDIFGTTPAGYASVRNKFLAAPKTPVNFSPGTPGLAKATAPATPPPRTFPESKQADDLCSAAQIDATAPATSGLQALTETQEVTAPSTLESFPKASSCSNGRAPQVKKRTRVSGEVATPLATSSASACTLREVLDSIDAAAAAASVTKASLETLQSGSPSRLGAYSKAVSGRKGRTPRVQKGARKGRTKQWSAVHDFQDEQSEP